MANTNRKIAARKGIKKRPKQHAGKPFPLIRGGYPGCYTAVREDNQKQAKGA